MTEFDDYSGLEFEKDANDIEKAVPMPEDWVVFQLTKAPEIKANKAKANNPDDPKAGDNWVVSMKAIHPDEQFNNRPMTLWLPLPGPKDRGKYTPMGQPLADSKQERIVDFIEKFGGSIQGKNVGISKGACGQAYVVQQLSEQTGDIMNSINQFAGFKRVPDGFEPPELPDEGLSDEDIPF